MATAAPESLPARAETTLDEPVWQTVWRDAAMVGTKVFHVVWPFGKGVRVLRDWDLWGPLVFCFVLSLMLSFHAKKDQTSMVFSAVFVIVWLGSIVVTLNAKVLGGNCSIFQSVCVLGYCIFPLVIASILCSIIGNIIFRLVMTAAGFVWSTYSSLGFMAELVPPTRKYIAIYPLLLFYFAVGWMVLIWTRST